MWKRIQKMAESLIDNRSRDMWAEFRKIKGQNNNLFCSIESAKCDEDITNVFFMGNIILFIIVCLMTRMK